MSGAGAAELVTLSAARAHLRLEDDYPAAQLQVYIDAACLAAAEFLNRRIFATMADMTAAVADTPADLSAAVAAHTAALALADLYEDAESRCSARADADALLRAARALATETRRGIIINAAIQAAILLTLGHLFENRQENIAGTIVSELKTGPQQLLMPFRIGMGV